MSSQSTLGSRTRSSQGLGHNNFQTKKRQSKWQEKFPFASDIADQLSPQGDLNRDTSLKVSSNDSPLNSSDHNLNLNVDDDLLFVIPTINRFASVQAFPGVYEKSELMNEACEALLGDEATFSNREHYGIYAGSEQVMQISTWEQTKASSESDES